MQKLGPLVPRECGTCHGLGWNGNFCDVKPMVGMTKVILDGSSQDTGEIVLSLDDPSLYKSSSH